MEILDVVTVAMGEEEQSKKALQRLKNKKGDSNGNSTYKEEC